MEGAVKEIKGRRRDPYGVVIREMSEYTVVLQIAVRESNNCCAHI